MHYWLILIIILINFYDYFQSVRLIETVHLIETILSFGIVVYRVFNLKVDHFDHMLQSKVLKEEFQNTTEIDP